MTENSECESDSSLSLNNITEQAFKPVFLLKKDPITTTTKLWWKKWSTDKVCENESEIGYLKLDLYDKNNLQINSR